MCALAVEPPSAKVDDLAWLAGRWECQIWGGTFEEQWSVPRAGSMLGHGRLMRSDRTVFVETMAIEADPTGTLVLYVRPGGHKSEAKPTPFRLLEISKDSLVWSNPEHDFPQRIAYQREGEQLTVQLNGVEDGKSKSETLNFKRLK